MFSLASLRALTLLMAVLKCSKDLKSNKIYSIHFEKFDSLFEAGPIVCKRAPHDVVPIVNAVFFCHFFNTRVTFS